MNRSRVIAAFDRHLYFPNEALRPSDSAPSLTDSLKMLQSTKDYREVPDIMQCANSRE